MDEKIRHIIAELCHIDPSFTGREAELEPLIRQLLRSRPSGTVNPAFARTLRGSLLTSAHQQHPSPIRHMSFMNIFRQRPFAYAAPLVIGALVIGIVVWQTRDTEPTINRTVPPVTKTGPALVATESDFEFSTEDIDSAGIEPTATFTLSAKVPVSLDAVRNNLHVEPAVALDISETAENAFAIRPAEPLADGTIYQFALALASDDQGERQAAWAYQVKAPFTVVGTLPADRTTTVPLNSGIEVTFSHENVEAFEQYFSIDPAVSGRFEHHRRTWVFVSEGLAPRTVYTITVRAGLPLTNSDETLGSDTVFQFETSETESTGGQGYLEFTNQFAEFAPTVTPILQIDSYNTGETTLPITVWQYPTFDAFVDAAETLGTLPRWTSWTRRHPTLSTDGLIDVARFDATIQSYEQRNYISLPESLPPGQYLVTTTFQDQTRLILVQVTPLASYLVTSDRDTLLWVHDVATQEPVDATYAFVGGDTAGSLNAEQGLAQFPTPAELLDEERAAMGFFRVDRESDHALIPAEDNDYGFGRWWWGEPRADQDYWSYLSTDRTLYHPDDTIRFWGIARPRDGGISPAVTIRLESEFYGENGYEPTRVAETQMEPTRFHAVTGEIAFDALVPGGYTLGVYVGETRISSQYITVATFTKPAYQITVEPERRAVFAGEEVVFHIQSAFFDGTPVTNLSLTYSGSPYGGGSVTTDQDGRARLAFATTYAEGQEVNYSSLAVYPGTAEEAEITGSANVTIFPSRYELQIETDANEAATTGRIIATVREVNLDRLNASADEIHWDTRGDPVANQEVQLAVTEFRYEQREAGESYDFINKISRKTYTYEEIKTEIGRTTVRTDDQGRATWEIPVDRTRNYVVDGSTRDPGNRVAKASEYLWFGYGAYGTDYLHVTTTRDDQNTPTTVYAPGDTETLTIRRGNDALPSGDANRYLFYDAQRGIRTSTVRGEPTLNRTFTDEDVPNIEVYGVAFDGTRYITAGSRVLDFDASLRQLTLDVQSNQEAYAPGEDVNLTVTVRDRDDRPVDAEVNLSLIDEALASIQWWDGGSDPLPILYRSVSNGVLTVHASHREADLAPMAEGGGCFAAGTQILMADGSTKNIEDVVVGDRILTRAAPDSPRLVPGRVTETFIHRVAGLLIVNESLQVTPAHIVYLNGQWQPAGAIRVGDRLQDARGRDIVVESVRFDASHATVYNLEVEEYHTFVAGGVYVHNQKDGSRENFQDAAFYGSVETGADGTATASFTLPDNITSWRVTAQAVTPDLYAGGELSAVIATKPFFVTTTMNDTYLSHDQPTILLRGYGTGLASGQTVAYTVSWPSDASIPAQELSGTVGSPVAYQMPDLAEGRHRIQVAGRAGSLEDTIIEQLAILPSHLREQRVAYLRVTEDPDIAPSASGRSELTFNNLQRGYLYTSLRELGWNWGDRLDQKLARIESRQLLTEYFEESTDEESFTPSSFVTSEGGLAILPYASADPLFTAQVLEVTTDSFDHAALIRYFNRILDNRTSTEDQIAAALYGLAVLDEPVLTQINLALSPDAPPAPYNRILLALAVHHLGAVEYSRALYADLLAEFSESVPPYARMVVSSDRDDTSAATSLMAILAERLDDPAARGLWHYAQENPPAERLTVLETLAYLQTALPKRSADPVSFRYRTGDATEVVTLENAQTRTLSLSNPELAGLTFSEITGEVGVTVTQFVSLTTEGVSPDPQLSVNRTYQVDGKDTIAFRQGDTVRVTLRVFVSRNAIDGAYQLTDILPSGLRLLTDPYVRTGYTDRDWPYEVDGQAVKFYISRSGDQEQRTITYEAYVVSPGTYVAEPPLIQGFRAAGSRAIGSAGQVTIE